MPGGIGLTAWLDQVYSQNGARILGGTEGMLDGFASILPGGDIVVSEEAATYRPEMEWLAAQLNASCSEIGSWRVVDALPREDWQRRVYRFFELYDLANVPCTRQLWDKELRGELTVTPPMKPALEEKMWFALFWLKPLESFWRRELGDRAMLALRKVIPYTWLVDPEPLPRHAVLPRLETNTWEEVGHFSQKQRALILKISGFSEHAWGSRGVVVAQDMPQAAWQAELRKALAEFDTHPHILQQFHQGRLVEHDYLDIPAGELRRMRGRVRLCPYYFVGEKTTVCGGALATICPDDKKLLHGMTDAILVPAADRHRQGSALIFFVDKPGPISSCHRSPAIQSPDAGMNSQLLEEASKVIHEPQVLINMVSKRVRQLSAGSRAMVSVEGRMGLADIALAEIAQGKLILGQAQNGQKPEE